jgi:hypothetical protein
MEQYLNKTNNLVIKKTNYNGTTFYTFSAVTMPYHDFLREHSDANECRKLKEQFTSIVESNRDILTLYYLMQNQRLSMTLIINQLVIQSKTSLDAEIRKTCLGILNRLSIEENTRCCRELSVALKIVSRDGGIRYNIKTNKSKVKPQKKAKKQGSKPQVEPVIEPAELVQPVAEISGEVDSQV